MKTLPWRVPKKKQKQPRRRQEREGRRTRTIIVFFAIKHKRARARSWRRRTTSIGVHERATVNGVWTGSAGKPWRAPWLSKEGGWVLGEGMIVRDRVIEDARCGSNTTQTGLSFGKKRCWRGFSVCMLLGSPDCVKLKLRSLTCLHTGGYTCVCVLVFCSFVALLLLPVCAFKLSRFHAVRCFQKRRKRQTPRPTHRYTQSSSPFARKGERSLEVLGLFGARRTKERFVKLVQYFVAYRWLSLRHCAEPNLDSEWRGEWAKCWFFVSCFSRPTTTRWFIMMGTWWNICSLEGKLLLES